MTTGYTLIIPTFNRHHDLGRLLRYLERQKAEFPIVLLDSSQQGERERNAALVGSLALRVEHRIFDPDTPPFEKFWQGACEVKTEFCSLCGDDDVVMTRSLERIVEHLARHPEFSAAHGYYYSFYSTHEMGLTSVVYSSPSLDQDDPIGRLRALFQRYQAVTYAVYRTRVMADVLGKVRSMSSLLGRELLAGALTVSAGKVERIPVFYYGRSLGPSQFYLHWHPLEWMIDSPAGMFEAYVPYREILVADLLARSVGGGDAEKLRKLVDYIHLSYVAEYVRPDLFDYMIDEALRDVDPAQVLAGIWPRLAPSDSRALDWMRRSRWLRALRNRLVPGLKVHALSRLLRRRGDKLVRSQTAGGAERTYRLYEGFRFAEPRAEMRFDVADIENLLRELDTYE